MGVEPIPDDDHRPRYVPPEISQRHKNVAGTDNMLTKTLVHLAGSHQAAHRGSLTAFAHAPQGGRFPRWSLGCPRFGMNQEASVIDADDVCASTASFF
jgi:hypothetical protein